MREHVLLSNIRSNWDRCVSPDKYSVNSFFLLFLMYGVTKLLKIIMCVYVSEHDSFQMLLPMKFTFGEYVTDYCLSGFAQCRVGP